MKIINDYNDFLFENAVTHDLPFRLTDRLITLLNTIEHPISDRLLQLSNNRIKKDITLIDYDSDDFGKFKYVLSNKAYDIIRLEIEPIGYEVTEYITNRGNISNVLSKLSNIYVKTSIHKTVSKIFPNEFPANGKPGEDIESFANMIKSKRTSLFSNFKIVEGDDILKYYKEDSYDSNAKSSTLGSSCMRYDKCQYYLRFYSENKGVKLVILMSKDEEDKILGRALLWDIDEIDDETVENIKFMDRIYTIYDHDMLNFKEYAEKNGWLYKMKQNMSSEEYIFNPKDRTSKKLVLKTTTNFEENSNDTYPYMDTMKWFFPDRGFVTNRDDTGNDQDKYYFMESTSGYYKVDYYGGIYVEYYGRSFPENELVWCEFGEEWRLPADAIEVGRDFATKDYLQENMVYSEIQRKYIDKDDAVALENYDDHVERSYAEYNMSWCARFQEYYKNDDVEWSDYYETNIPLYDCVEVYLDIKKKKTDYREQDDDTYLTVLNEDGREEDYDRRLYDDYDDEYFIKVIYEMNPRRTKYDFVTNTNKYIKINGSYYDKKFEDELTGQLKIDFNYDETK